MADFVSKYAKPQFPVGSYAGGRVLQAAYGHMKAPTGVATNDTMQMTKVPYGATILRRSVFVDGVEVAAPVVGWAGTPGALNLIEAPVEVPTPAVNVTGNDTDMVIQYTVSAAEAVAAGDDVMVLIEYVYMQPKP